MDPPPDPGANNPVPVGMGTPLDYFLYFDLDGHDQIDFELAQFLDPIGPAPGPIVLPAVGMCIHPVENLVASYSDDMAPGWPVMDVPVTVPSASGKIYGSNAQRDEIIGYSLALLGPLPGGYAVVNTLPLAQESAIHPDLHPDPDCGRDVYDDDVDSLDITPRDDLACPFWLFTADHEAHMGLDPGDIYQVFLPAPGAAPVKVVDKVIHLGLAPDTDINAFEFVRMTDPQYPGGPILALIFSVDEDDPLTGPDESGGLIPQMVYYSYLTGMSWPLLMQPLQDNVDALAAWCEEVAPLPDVIAPTLQRAVSRKAHGAVPVELDQVLVLNPGPGAATSEPRMGGPTKVIAWFSEPIIAGDGSLDPNQEVQTYVNGVLDNTLITALVLNCDAIEVHLAGVPDMSCLRIVFSGITDLAGNALVGTSDVLVAALEGDANDTKGNTIADLAYVKARLAQTANSSNLRADVNLSGGITISDLSFVKARLTNAVTCP